MTDELQKFLAFVSLGADAAQDGKLSMADTAFQLALRLAQAAQPELGSNPQPLLYLHQSLLRQKQGRAEESNQLRNDALGLLDRKTISTQSRGYCYLMADALHKLGEYSRAIPFWERTILLTSEATDPTLVASDLHRLGECFCRVGLKDHAAVPLRAALRLMKDFHEDPRRAGLLLTLGNALRKSAPSEAEACYKEAAEWYAARLLYLSATPAWGNLGILCSELGSSL